MAIGYCNTIMQDIAYVTRTVNGVDITWLVKVYLNIDTTSPPPNSTAWCNIAVRELGTNVSASHTTVGDWTGTITDVTPETSSNVWIEDDYGTHMLPLDKGGIVQLTPSDTYKTISNEFQTVVFKNLQLEMNFINWIGYGEYADFQFDLQCPKNSVFDGYGAYSTNFLDGAYKIEYNNGYYKTNVYNDTNPYGMLLSGGVTYEDGCSFGEHIVPSEINAANGYIGSDIKVYIESDNGVSAFPILNKVYYSYDNSSWVDIPLANLAVRNFIWTIPMEFYAIIPNDRQGSIYFRVDTFGFDSDGNDLVIGSRNTTITAYTVEEDCIPELSPTMYDSNSVTVAMTGNKEHLIRHKSHATFNANPVVKNHATIARIEVTNGGQEIKEATGTFYGFTNDYFTFELVDSRGYSKTISVTPTIVPYILLTCLTVAEAPTADGDLNFTIQGNYWDGNFGVKSNSLKVFYRIKEIKQSTGEGAFSEWIELPYELGTNKYTSLVTIGNLDYRNTFIIEAYAVDIFGTIYADEEATSALPIFDWGINDFNMNCDMTVYGTLTVNGNVVATGSVNGQGSNVSSYEIHYGTCQSAGDVSAKLVTCPTFTNLATGSSIRVKFAYANTVANVVMNVNNTGAISVKKNDEDRDLTGAWKKGAVRDFVYDGTNWLIVSYD